MKLFLSFFLVLNSVSAFAIGCDCEVLVYSPITGSYQAAPNRLKTYELEEYDTYAVKNQNECRQSCLKEYEKDMPSERLKALLLSYSENLIQEKAVGYNCTGLTTLKYPVRVKAILGELSLGNVADNVHVVNYEEVCF